MKRVLEVLGILALGLTLAAVMLHPMFWAKQDRQPVGDATMMIWNIWHTTESTLAGQSPLQTDRWLWPDGTSLGRHTLWPGFALVGIVTKIVMGGNSFYPFYAYRAIALLSFALLFALTYWLLRQLGCRSLAAGVIAGTFAYGNFFFSHIQQINLPGIFFFPLVSLLLLRFHRQPTIKSLVVLGAAIAISVYFTEMVIFWLLGFAFFLVFCLATARGRDEIQQTVRQSCWWWWPVAGIISFLIASPFLWAFSQVEERSLAESASIFSANLSGFFVPSRQFDPLIANWFGISNHREIRGEEEFLGYVIPGLALAGFWLAAKRRYLIGPLVITALFFLLLSLGPDLKIGETVYEDVLPYSYVLAETPPFTSFRAPIRLAVVALFILLIPAGLSLSRIMEKGRWGQILAGALCLLAAVESYPPESRWATNDSIIWKLGGVFAIPPPELPELLDKQGKPGAWATLPPQFHDRTGVLAQMFHGQPIFAGCWLGRWDEKQEAVYKTYWQEYCRSVTDDDPGHLASWLKTQGVKNVLVVGEATVGEDYLASLGQDINVVDGRVIFRPELEPFALLAQLQE